MKKILKILASIFFLSGVALIIYPNISKELSNLKSKVIIDSFNEKKQNNLKKGNNLDNPLYAQMQKYNKEIYDNKQNNLKDAWSYQQPIFKLSNYSIDNEAVGYISIETMGIKIPLFLGATKENLANGVAVLGQTSMPIGGENTNCVIAGHRGWKGIPMFVNIEKLKLGDVVILENLWDSLYYQVSDIKIISPTDIEAIKIQDGKDLLTLITCHPYRQNYQRYVVYCQRSEENNLNIYKSDKLIDKNLSQNEIDKEEKLNKVALMIVIVIIILISIIYLKKLIKTGI